MTRHLILHERRERSGWRGTRRVEPVSRDQQILKQRERSRTTTGEKHFPCSADDGEDCWRNGYYHDNIQKYPVDVQSPICWKVSAGNNNNNSQILLLGTFWIPDSNIYCTPYVLLLLLAASYTLRCSSSE